MLRIMQYLSYIRPLMSDFILEAIIIKEHHHRQTNIQLCLLTPRLHSIPIIPNVNQIMFDIWFRLILIPIY
jgi:hypothetical protein